MNFSIYIEYRKIVEKDDSIFIDISLIVRYNCSTNVKNLRAYFM